MTNKALTAGQIRDLIRDEMADWGSQKAVARRMNISPQYLCDVMLQRREPGPRIAAYFDMKVITYYVPIGEQQP